MHISITPETVGHAFGLSITNTLLTSWLVVILLVALSIIISRKIKTVPGTLQNLAEWVIEKLLDFMETVAGDRSTPIRFFPFVATIFIFVLLSNWLGILPGVGSIGFFEHGAEGEVFVPLFRSVNSDLSMTLALALLTVIGSHVIGFLAVGAKHHIGKFLSFKSPVAFFVGLLEIVSEISKILSLSFRLFGNILAGEVLLVIIASLVPYIVPLPFLGLELFVGLIQALIFSVLAMVAMATSVKVATH